MNFTNGLGTCRKGGASWDNLQPDSPSNNVPGGFMVVQGEWDIDPKTQVQKNQGEPVPPVTSALLSGQQSRCGIPA